MCLHKNIYNLDDVLNEPYATTLYYKAWIFLYIWQNNSSLKVWTLVQRYIRKALCMMWYFVIFITIPASVLTSYTTYSLWIYCIQHIGSGELEPTLAKETTDTASCFWEVSIDSSTEKRRNWSKKYCHCAQHQSHPRSLFLQPEFLCLSSSISPHIFYAFSLIFYKLYVLSISEREREREREREKERGRERILTAWYSWVFA